MWKAAAFIIICTGFILVFSALAKLIDRQDTLNRRVLALERKVKATVEIVVERAYDGDMGVYGYKLIAVKEEK